MDSSAIKSKNMTKGQQYKAVVLEHNEACKNKMYIAAIMLDYAILEDRLSILLAMLDLLTDNDETKKYEISNIGKSIAPKVKHSMFVGKLKLLQKALNISNDPVKNNMIPAEINAKIKILDTQKIQENIKKLLLWAEKRNSLVHGLMDKAPSDIAEKEMRQVEAIGFKSFRAIDTEIRKLRRYKKAEKAM